MKKTILFFMVILFFSCSAGLSGLKGEYRNGQVFLQWQEKSLPADARLAVWGSNAPITEQNLDKAEQLADMLNLNSACDWWRDAANFLGKRTKAMREDEPFANNAAEKENRAGKQGFVISDMGKPIPGDGGLHVHTPSAAQTGKRYFAVTAQVKGKRCGFTALAKAIEVGPGKCAPIAIGGKFLKKGSCKGLPLLIALHGRGGGSGVDNKGRALGSHVIYVSRDLAWREGIPFKFQINKTRDSVTMILYDRIWIGRILQRGEFSDGRDRVNAISTFWFGYNPNIARSLFGPDFKADNYTERYILHLIRWAQEYLGTDPAATYVTGGSMGGSGAIQLATRYPDVFAAVTALVPVYSYTWARNGKDQKGQVIGATGNSITRVICSVGKFTQKNPGRMVSGGTVEDFLSGAKNINRPGVDITPIIATNGRQDKSIPWVNNPPFYRAANEARQSFSVFWNNGSHAMSGKTPEDMKKHRELAGMLRYRLDRSFPAFSNCSDNKNYGNGHPADGDLRGWINRGFVWKDIVDTPAKYAIAISMNHPEIKYPVTADITFRRRQQFKFPAGTRLTAVVNGKKMPVSIDKNGLLTLEKVSFKDAKFIRIEISK